MAVLSGELLSGKAAKTRAKRTRTSGEAYFLFVNGRYHFNSLFTIGNQAFTPDGCIIFPGLSYNKANNTFLNSLRS